MSAVLASWHRYRTPVLIDIALLAALYLLPTLSHMMAVPLYKLEPMRIALVVALLFTQRANAYLIAWTIPLASFLLSGHPELFKAMLIGIEYSVLVAAYGFLAERRKWSPFPALVVAILAGKLVYYGLKALSLNAGLLEGNLVSTPLQTQAILAAGTAAVFAFVLHRRQGRSPR
jgi:hypothetical protein